MSAYQIKPIDRNYNQEMLQILQSSPITTRDLTLYFDRQPSIFKMADIKYRPHHYHGLFLQDQLKGFGMIGYHQAMVNRNQEMVFHIKDFYVAPEARGNGFVYRVAENLFRETYQQASIGYAIVMRGNKNSLHFVGRKNPAYPFFPHTRIVNQLDVRNMLLLLPLMKKPGFKIRPATSDDIPVMVSLLNAEHRMRLFGNCYEETGFQDYLKIRPGLNIQNYYLAFDKNGRCVGVCAAWDCSSIKQTRVMSYGKQFLPARLLYNSLATLFKKPLLPSASQFFKEFFVTDYAVAERNPAIMNSLLRFIYREYLDKGYQNMIWGSSLHDPLLQASAGFFHQRLISNIVLVATEVNLMEESAIENHLPYIDLPFL
mgnify:CR=1 FL=1